jgi:hypothetical protein
VSAFGQVVITDTGSTNRMGMTVTIDDNGTAEIAPRRGTPVKMDIPSDMHARLMQDVEAAMPLDQLAVTHCAKSVSFGSRMFVTYKGVKSPDISCGGQTDPAAIALQKDANDIMTMAITKVPTGRPQFQ